MANTSLDLDSGAGVGPQATANTYITDYAIEPDLFATKTLIANTLLSKLQKESAELSNRQKDVEQLHQLTQLIENGRDKTKKTFDTSKFPDVQPMLERAKELGIAIPEQTKGLLTEEQTNMFLKHIDVRATDLLTQNNTQMSVIASSQRELEQLFESLRANARTLQETNRSIISHFTVR